jgi:mannose-1-phosphate guanylyltransferase/mannose-6-phosphate isomerase
MTPPTFAVILAGGSGTRLWPVAGANNPKPFLPLIRGKSTFRLTFERCAPVSGRNRVLVVAGVTHRKWVRRQAPEVAADRILLEEMGRNTAAAVATAALWIRARCPEGVMVVLPSDHFVTPAGVFRSAIRSAAQIAASSGALLTIGIPARSPDTGFGYIRPSGRPVAPRVRRVSEFVEKPDAATARRMVRTGKYFWNSGIFVWRAASILGELRRHRPDILGPLESWARSRVKGAWRVPAGVLRRVPASPIDKAVLERSDRTLVMRAPFSWSDLGNWAALGEILPRDRFKNGGIGRTVAVDSSGCLGINETGLTVFVGVHDLIAVRSGDALLVCHRGAAQRVRFAALHLPRPWAPAL